MSPITETEVYCFHCGEPCNGMFTYHEKSFCCIGCQTVYEIVSASDLCEYYDLQQNPGVSLRYVQENTYAFLDEPDIRKKILSFDSDDFARVQLQVPAIHCVSCIWLLENLQRLNLEVLRSEVNFARKQVTIDFKPGMLSLSALARLLASVGYPPHISLEQEQPRTLLAYDKSLLLKLVVAGFCFGNVMLLSFPEYLGMDGTDEHLTKVFSYLNILLSIPVFLYSDVDYLKSARRSVLQRQINIDVPIAAGLVALFIRSVWDIATGFGPGYMDSFTGLVFFLLIGRWFQNKTYESLAFDRDFTSYFPLAVLRNSGDEWKPVIVYNLEERDRIKIRNLEIIPADSVLLDEEAWVDYSFVTGESKPVKVKKGARMYAGGKIVGEAVQLLVEKKTAQSQLTSLWNNEAFRKPDESKYKKLIDRAARRFTWVILGLSVITTLYWYWADPSQVWLILTSVLIVACPCALALTAPFTYGNMMRVFGRHHLYLKNADTVERMASVNAVVFDKTGTVTHGQHPEIIFQGILTKEEEGWIHQLTGSSTHPLSKLIHQHTSGGFYGRFDSLKEIPGKGIEGRIGPNTIRVGSPDFTGSAPGKEMVTKSRVYVSINGTPKGLYEISTSVRKNLKDMLSRLGERCVAMLSGDNKADATYMQALFHPSVQLHFNQSPQGKLNYISELQKKGRRVMMLGDGLNDSGALRQSNVGIAVTDDTGVFTPACDAILQGNQLQQLDKFLALARSATTIVKAGFVLSFMYNAVALSFAVTGYLTPLVAAILMPLSSMSVVVFTTVAVNWSARKHIAGEKITQSDRVLLKQEKFILQAS